MRRLHHLHGIILCELFKLSQTDCCESGQLVLLKAMLVDFP